jgi:hypothetical protein
VNQSKRKSAGTSSPETARLSCKVSTEAYQRLFVASVMGGQTASEILDKLIKDHCREWSLPGKISERSVKHDRVVPSVEVSDSAPPPALQDAA